MHVAKNQAASAAKRRLWKSKTLKLVRRLHLYAGLLLMPWVLLFGVSGLLFNHPNWASSRDIIHHADAEAVQATTGFVALDGEQLARQIAARLNDGYGGRFSVAEDAISRLTGRFSVRIPGAGALHTVRINLADGSALIETAAEAPELEPPPFAGQPVHIDAPNFAAIGDKSVELLAAAGLEATGPARIRARPAPVLQFELWDEDGRGWHATYDLIKGTLDGRRADAGTGFSFREAVTRLHQLKMYPDQIRCALAVDPARRRHGLHPDLLGRVGADHVVANPTDAADWRGRAQYRRGFSVAGDRRHPRRDRIWPARPPARRPGHLAGNGPRRTSAR